MAMKRIALVCLALSAPVAMSAAPVFAQTTTPTKISKVKARVAFVDVDRCVGETEDGLRAKSTLAKARLRQDSILLSMEDRIRSMEQRLQEMLKVHQASGKAQPPPELQKLAMDYQRDMQTYQTSMKQMQGDLEGLENQLFLPIEKKVKLIFTKLAEERGLDILVDRKSMPVTMKPDLDLTEEVIRRYNWPNGVGVAKPAASAAPAASTAAKPPAPKPSAAPPPASPNF
jgi:Skp family chaperone for outer membrane proteins